MVDKVLMMMMMICRDLFDSKKGNEKTHPNEK